jgi:hypothetical protein
MPHPGSSDYAVQHRYGESAVAARRIVKLINVYTFRVYMMIEAEVKQWGNSYGIRFSKKIAKQLKIEPGEKFWMEIKNDYYTVDRFFGICKGSRPFKRDPDDFHF